MNQHLDDDVVICWVCRLPVPTVDSPVGQIADPAHDCIQALKKEVWDLREKLAELLV